MSNVVETVAKTDFLEIPSKCSNVQAQEQEVKDYTEFLKIEYQKYRKYKILLEGIEECIEDENNLDEELVNKVKNIILEASVSQTSLSDNANEESWDTVLGITLTNSEITYSESGKLLSCLKSKLVNKTLQLKNDCFSLFGKGFSELDADRGESPLDLSKEDKSLLEYRNKLDLEQEYFLRNQIELLELLEEQRDIRLKTVPEVTEQKIEECSLRSKINYLKSQLAKGKCRIDIFMETGNSLKAYTEIIIDMKNQRDELYLEIAQLKDLKKKYAEVSCKEYDDILKSYLQYKSSFEKKKMMYKLYG